MITVYCGEKRRFNIGCENITIRQLYEIAKQEGKADYQVACWVNRDSEDIDSITFEDETKTVYI